jgi:hypothetical protein
VGSCMAVPMDKSKTPPAKKEGGVEMSNWV